MNDHAIASETLDAAMSPDQHLAPIDPALVDTLTAADVVRPVSVDDALLGRDLKQRLFGKRPAVRIGRYEVLSRIGRGGMGTVYLARDPELDRTVALKVLRDDRQDGHTRMLNEARSLARLTHPNVVTVHEVGTHDGRVFLAMEFIEGPTLRVWLERERSVDEILEVFAQAAAGLAAAHAVGLVHRDFKPENVIIGSDGRVRVVDFGVAKAPGDAAPASTAAQAGAVDLTHTGQVLGTPAYMAAEQFLGAGVDRRADVFALCVSLHEAFAGERPFAGDDPMMVSLAVARDQARTLDSQKLPRSLAPLLRRGLLADPAQRPTLEELLVELRPRPRRGSTRLQAALAAVAGIGVATVAAVVLFTAKPVAQVSDPAELEGYAALVAATEDDDRVRLGEAFLATFGESSDPARRAVAHAIVGHVQWDRSCPTPSMGLCVAPQAISAEAHCRPPTRGPFTARTRDAEAQAALAHFAAVTELAGIEPPVDETLAEQWRDAVGGSLVRVADHDLEQQLVIEYPKGLDFETSEPLSKTAFGLFFDRIRRDGSELATAYAAVKGTTPKWEIIAGARTGLLYESTANVFASHAPPPTMVAERARLYCDVVDDLVIGKLRSNAHNACTWSTDKAQGAGMVELAEASGCAAPTSP
jgi:tRNA A-37 threonylcarbamoyl transferase component Bud32